MGLPRQSLNPPASPRQLAHPRQEGDQPVGTLEGLVRGRREHVHAEWDSPDLRHLGGHLAGRQDPAVRWFGTLRELELDHLDGLEPALLGEALGVEAAALGPTAEIARFRLATPDRRRRPCGAR